MYENQYPDVYNQKREDGDGATAAVNAGIDATAEMSTDAGTTANIGAGMSTNMNSNMNANMNRANHYYNNNNDRYGYGTGTWQNTNYGPNAGSYQYGNTYPNDYQDIYNKKAKKKKDKKEKSGSCYFKKALACISLGLFFGICAGIGFYAVEAATGMLDRGALATEVTEKQDGGGANTENSEEVTSNSVTYSANGTEIQKTQTVTTVVSDVSEVVSAVMPAAVAIKNTYTETMSYFGQAVKNEAEASGSGIIVGKNDTELLIATNYHVIEGANKLSVQFIDGSDAESSVKGTDADMDIAVIAVPLSDIPSSALDQITIATLGDSDTLKIGEPAIAIGNALGYGQSVTTGCVSALDREMELSDGSIGTFIQTDAAINPGNSGGALLNIKGEVIGINSNKIGGSVIEGMGYAIPISAASPIIADLMLKETKSKVAEDERGFLGISGISVTADVSSAYGMPKGVYIAQVYDGTAAAAAGLKKGDIIVAFDGESISSMDELQRVLEYYAKGDTVDIEIMTVGTGGYHSETVSITLGNKVEQ